MPEVIINLSKLTKWCVEFIELHPTSRPNFEDRTASVNPMYFIALD